MIKLIYKNLKTVHPDYPLIGNCFIENNGNQLFFSDLALENGLINQELGIAVVAKYWAAKTPDNILETGTTLMIYKAKTNEIIELTERYYCQMKVVAIEQNGIKVEMFDGEKQLEGKTFELNFDKLHAPISYNFVPFTSFGDLKFDMPIDEAISKLGITKDVFMRDKTTVQACDKSGFHLSFDENLKLEFIEIFGPLKLKLNGVEIFDILRRDFVKMVQDQNIEHQLGGQDINVKGWGIYVTSVKRAMIDDPEQTPFKINYLALYRKGYYDEMEALIGPDWMSA